MQIKTIFAVSVYSAAFLSFATAGYCAEPEMKWSAQGGLALPGLEQTTLIGDPSSAASDLNGAHADERTRLERPFCVA